MSVAGKEDDAGKAQAEEVSQWPKVSENVKEEVAVLKDEGNTGELIKKFEEETVDQKEIAEKECSLLSSDGNSKENDDDGECFSDAKDGDSSPGNGFLSDLKAYEKKALIDLRSKLEEAILTNKLFKKVISTKDQDKCKNNVKQEHPNEEEGNITNKGEAKVEEEEEKKGQEDPNGEDGNTTDKGKAKVEEEEDEKQENPNEGLVTEKGKAKVEEEEEDKKLIIEYEAVDKDISLWGVPLLPSKGDQRTDVLLLKFLRARDCKPEDALDMLKSSLGWRKENRIDSIMEEDFGNEFDCVGYVKGIDREGHPVCYNVYGLFGNEEMYNKTFGSESGRERFLRWRLQLLEKEIQKLDFGPGGVSTLLQVHDIKDTPGPSRRDIRLAMKWAVGILQDNYPEFVAKNIFVNVPFWYYAFNTLLMPTLTQTTKSKIVFSRASKVTDTLVKYIAAEEIPSAYGGLRREDDPEFSTKDAATEIIVKAGTTETIEIPAPEVGNTLTWDVMIVGWDVNYKEEFVPRDEGSYTMIVKKEKRVSWQQESIRNSFINKEVGKLVITITNGIFKKKRLLYRYKFKNQST